ncbi:hypothetical protein BDB01DRAFT_779194, partial [Pilobolus umbonatus]
MITFNRHSSISSSNCSSNRSSHSIWYKISSLFHTRSRSSTRSSKYCQQSSSSLSLSDESIRSDTDMHSITRRHRKQLKQLDDSPYTSIVIPPFSPTYCKTNEFPYSNFYVKLPDGRWMVRYRDGNRDILRTDIIEGYM